MVQYFGTFLRGLRTVRVLAEIVTGRLNNISLQRCRYITLLSYSCSYVASGYVGTNIQVVVGNVIVQRGMKAWLSFLHFSVVLMEVCDRVRVGV